VESIMDIGERIVKLRKKRNWNQRELARRAGLNYSVMNRIETGKRPLTDQEIKTFADLFGVSTDYLLGLTDNPTPTTRDKLKKLRLKENEEIHLFDLEGLSDEDIEFIENQIEFLRKKAKQQRKDTE